jgi:2-dehydro-3-deoxyphosphogluconate aldolase / (4S)-4-hydroxy-2-oxoglutarate aldolase
MMVPEAPRMIRDIVQHYGDGILTGAGTVIGAKQADLCLDAGAKFLVSPSLVSPGLVLPVLQAAKKMKHPRDSRRIYSH